MTEFSDITERIIDRSPYLERLKNDAAVKFLTGIRRGGKSFLLHQMIDVLKNDGVEAHNIDYLDFESFVFSPIQNKKELINHIDQKVKECELNGSGKFYFFLDEVQNISGWEKVISTFIDEQNIGFFVSSSTLDLKSIAKKKDFEGKYTEIKINPLSYSEYRAAQTVQSGKGLLHRALALNGGCVPIREAFEKYVKRGGFPTTVFCSDIEKKTFIRDIYASILYNDIILKYNVINTTLLGKIIKYIFENVGEECSASKLVKLFKSENYNKNLSNVSSYLKYLENSFIIKRVRRINLKTGKVQAIASRYYVGDHALIYAISDGITEKRLLENILVNELSRRDYEVLYGKLGVYTIDFAARKGEKKLFIQTIYNKEDSDEITNEKIDAINSVVMPDGTTALKYLISLDGGADDSLYEGLETETNNIKQINLPSFLLAEEY